MSAATECARCYSELETGDLRCPVCAQVAPEGEARREVARAQARVVRCRNCGASLTYSAEVRAPRCAYCDSVMEVQVELDPQEQAERYIPFAVDEQSAREALAHFVGRKSFFRPSDLSSRATLDSLQPLWWPAWAFRSQALVSWTADSDAGSHRSDWAPHSGQVEMTFEDVLVSASRGLTADECNHLSVFYRLAGAEAQPRGPQGALVERFDVTRSGARRQILEALEALARKRVEEGHIPGTQYRKVHVAAVPSRLETTRFALPAYVLAYRYRKRLYRVVVHGEDAECIIGEAPTSWWKTALVVAGVLALLMLIRWLLR